MPELLERAGIGRVTLVGSECHLGEGVAGAENVDDLLLACRVHAINVYGTTLDDVKPIG